MVHAPRLCRGGESSSYSVIQSNACKLSEGVLMSGIVYIHHKNRNDLYDKYNISPATLSGNILLMSGLVGFRPDGSVANSLEEQIELIFEQAKDVLEEAGGDFSNI